MNKSDKLLSLLEEDKRRFFIVRFPGNYGETIANSELQALSFVINRAEFIRYNDVTYREKSHKIELYDKLVASGDYEVHEFELSAAKEIRDMRKKFKSSSKNFSDIIRK